MPPWMARLACSVSAKSVALESRATESSALMVDPDKNFLSAEAPIFAKAVTRQMLCRSLPCACVHPRRWYLQQRCHFVDGQKTTFVLSLIPRGRVL
jgi:hypothetical protein